MAGRGTWNEGETGGDKKKGRRKGGIRTGCVRFKIRVLVVVNRKRPRCLVVEMPTIGWRRLERRKTGSHERIWGRSHWDAWRRRDRRKEWDGQVKGTTELRKS